MRRTTGLVPTILPPGFTPGFSALITLDTELRGGILVAEFSDATYEPVAPVSSIREAMEIGISAKHLRSRLPIFRVWAAGIEGRMRVARTF